jgi:hypothetical protein
MNVRIGGYEHITPQAKADLIYRAAQREMAQRLWRTAVSGRGEDAAPSSGAGVSDAAALSLDSLLALLHVDQPQDRTVRADGAREATPLALSGMTDGPVHPTASNPSNIAYRPLLESAAARTGIAPEAIEAIINAEAARHPDGSWNAQSRNPRSSAAGLGQFLSGSWIALAERPGSALNRTAQAQGWIGPHGKVVPGARGALLALRDDPRTSIEAVADYARDAYLGHHLGPGDAVRFYRGTLDPDRARTLLNAQIGASNASRHIAQAGDPVAAHRRWLMSYVARAVRIADAGSIAKPPAKI